MLTAQSVAAGPDESDFSLFGFNEAESYVIIGAMCLLALLLLVVAAVIISKRAFRFRVSRGNNSAEIALNESSQRMVNTSVVSTV